MSRLIKMTPEYMDECRAEFEKALSLAKLSDGKLNYTKVFSGGDKKAVVYFTATAWAKMVLLIKEFDKEVAWHGVAHRVGEVEGEAPLDTNVKKYVITDIVVYPQTVSASTVEMDTEKYAEWLMKNADDERFNHLFMQGHSHVNMAPSPSSVDLNHQEEILEMMGEHDFYIFMIWNKSFASNIKVYDMNVNTLYENGDVTVKLLDEDESLDEFLKGAKSMVENRVYSHQSYQNRSTTAAATQPKTQNQTNTGPFNPLAPVSTPAAAPDLAPASKSDKPRTRIGAGWYGRNAAQQAISGFGDDDDDDNPYNWSAK